MNPEELKQKIAYYYERLPADVQPMFASMAWLETLKRVSVKFALNDKQIETLGTETTLVLLGIIHVGEYESNLAKELGLQRDTLDNLLMEINGLILNPVRAQINRAFEANLAEPMQEKPAATGAEPTPKSDYADAFLEVSRIHRLSVTQMGVLENLVRGIMDGTGDATKFEQALERGAWLSREKAHAVTVDLNEKVFKNIRKVMMAGQTDITPNVLKSAGIEILPSKPKVEFQTNIVKNDREEMLKKIENPNLINGPKEIEAPRQIHEQKLAGSYQLPKKETHYEEKPQTQGPAQNEDPYREPLK